MRLSQKHTAAAGSGRRERAAALSADRASTDCSERVRLSDPANVLSHSLITTPPSRFTVAGDAHAPRLTDSAVLAAFSCRVAAQSSLPVATNK